MLLIDCKRYMEFPSKVKQIKQIYVNFSLCLQFMIIPIAIRTNN